MRRCAWHGKQAQAHRLQSDGGRGELIGRSLSLSAILTRLAVFLGRFFFVVFVQLLIFLIFLIFSFVFVFFVLVQFLIILLLVLLLLL